MKTKINTELDPKTMTFIEDGIKEKVSLSLANLRTLQEEGRASLDSVIKTTCFLSDIENFAGFNEVYTEVFSSDNAPDG